MPHFQIDWTFNIGSLLNGLLLTLIGWGVRKSFLIVKQYIDRQNKNEDDLHRGLRMIDRHTLALRKAALLGPPATRVWRRRHDDNGELDILDDPPENAA